MAEFPYVPKAHRTLGLDEFHGLILLAGFLAVGIRDVPDRPRDF
ncbi:hypothetical protein [Deinococcus irradiatisoli]|nr:hypothetical protein [Deinococcus irradiatisoli]